MYGASVWYEMMKNEYARKIINGCQRIVLYACLRVCRTVCVEAMQVLMGVLPWDLEVMKRAIAYKLRKNVCMNDIDVLNDREVEENGVKVCMKLVEDRLMNEWQNRWNACEKGRVTFENIRNVRHVRKKELFDPGVYLYFLLTGHGSLNEYLKRRNLC
jgi:hypothetical protein